MGEPTMFLIKHNPDDFYENNQFLIVLATDREEAKRKAKKEANFPGNPDYWIVEPQVDVIRFTINVV